MSHLEKPYYILCLNTSYIPVLGSEASFATLQEAMLGFRETAQKMIEAHSHCSRESSKWFIAKLEVPAYIGLPPVTFAPPQLSAPLPLSIPSSTYDPEKAEQVADGEIPF